VTEFRAKRKRNEEKETKKKKRKKANLPGISLTVPSRLEAISYTSGSRIIMSPKANFKTLTPNNQVMPQPREKTANPRENEATRCLGARQMYRGGCKHVETCSENETQSAPTCEPSEHNDGPTAAELPESISIDIDEARLTSTGP